MIPRYSRPEMSAIWSEETKLQIWLEVEVCALEAMAEHGLAPKEAAAAVRAKAMIRPERAAEIEKEVKHDVIAFLTSISEVVGPEARYLHRGMTSNDLLDTAFAVQCKRAGEHLIQGVSSLRAVLLKRAEEWKYLPCVGRSHGIHGEPMSFGVKVLSWYSELGRAQRRLVAALSELCVGKIAGAVGTYASIPPAIEAQVMKRLGLGIESVPSQVVQRDRHAAFMSSLALMVTSIERLAVELRHLQRSEVREVEEFFSPGQKGSSAMPHKRNPISAENITGIARLVRGYLTPTLENIPLWHERDISHSSVERVVFPDACIATDYLLHRCTELVSKLVVYPERMMSNLLQNRGLVFSGTLLISLTDRGMSREDAYRVVQHHALQAWDGGASLEERVTEDPEIVAVLGKEGIKQAFNLERHLAHVDFIFNRVRQEEQP